MLVDKKALTLTCGKWNNSGFHTIPFKSWYTEEGDVELERLKPGYSGLDVQILRQIHYVHPSDARCKHMLAFITGQCQCFFVY